jgi:hypothetical protein
MPSSENAPVPQTGGVSPVLGPSYETITEFQQDVERLLGSAVRTLHELCEMADSEPVRLNAAVQILTFAGMRPYRRRSRPLEEEAGDASVTTELALLLEKLDRNRPGIVDAVQDAARQELDRAEVLDAEVVEDEDGPPA